MKNFLKVVSIIGLTSITQLAYSTENNGGHNIGDTGPAGGIVFYVTDDGLHGLEAAPNDSEALAWGCGGERINGAFGAAIGTGGQNTFDIASKCGESSAAAAVVANTKINGLLGWYLPSKEELHEMWDKLADSDGDGTNSGPTDPNNLGGFAAGYYWSSSQSSSKYAWYRHFLNGRQAGWGNKSLTRKVRAVRAF
ncbi:MAG: hypothetical protein ACI8XX_000160 [Polaribacter sp.]|jgi:hypothetical protein